MALQGARAFLVAGTKSTREKQPVQTRGMAVVQMCRLLGWLSIHGEKLTSLMCAYINNFQKFGHIYNTV